MSALRFDPLAAQKPQRFQAAKQRINRSFRHHQIGIAFQTAENFQTVKFSLPEHGENRQLQAALAKLDLPFISRFLAKKVVLHYVRILLYKVSCCQVPRACIFLPLWLRRLVVPFLFLLFFLLVCVTGYMSLKSLRFANALFWVAHPHAIEYRQVHTATKCFSLFVTIGILAFEIWFAERILLTFIGHQGREVWRSMLNEMNLERVRDHFIICGYGQVGCTVVEQLNRSRIPFVLIATNEGLYRQLLHEGALVIQGDAKSHRVLQAAGTERAVGLCVVIDNDAENL
jgi:TrkA-N domain